MTQTRTEYADTCEVTNTDRGRTVTGEILNFVPQKLLDVSVDRSVKISMRWQPAPNKNFDYDGLYIGSVSGMEFTSHGPEQVTYRLSK
jgi:hypothetical protein